jgi:two-component system, NtrC family, sensor kinase
MRAPFTTREPVVAPAIAPLQQSAWRPLVQFLPYAVLLLDDGLRVVIANKAASRLFQLPVTHMTGAPLASLIPSDNVAKWLADFAGQRTKVLETPVESPGASIPRVTLRIAAVRLARAACHRRGANAGSKRDGEYRLLVVEDITDRAALEQQLVESEKQAAMGQLAAGILHEVANPLAGLGSNLVFVRSGLADRPRELLEGALDVSLEQLHQMRQLLGTLSGFPGRAAPMYEPANLVEVVRRAVAFITAEARRRGLRVHLSCEAPEIVCEMDIRLMRQVMLNVLKNALEAISGRGRIDVRVRRRTDRGADASAVIDVLDTGVGILPADLRRAFRPLFSTKPRGAGLGLSFCRQTVEEHGGLITLRSPGRDRGTHVTISLPLRQHGHTDDGNCDAAPNRTRHR